MFNKDNKKIFLMVSSSVFIMAVLLFIINVVVFKYYDEDEAVKIYYADHIYPVYQELIDEFNEQNKGKIEVIPVNLPSYTTNERKEVLSRYLRGNDILDIFAVDQIWIPRFAKWGSSLDKYFEGFVDDKIIENALVPCYKDNKLVAVPFNIDLSVIYYRKDLLKKVKNYDEIENKLKSSISWEDLKKLKKYFPDNDFYLFQADDYEGLVISFIELLYQQGKNLYENGKLQLVSDEAVFALNHLKNLIKKGYSPKYVTTLREGDSKEEFIKKNAIFLRGWPSFKKEFRVFTNDEKILNNIEVAAIPHLEGKNEISISGGWNLMISKYSEHKEEAAKFIRFMLSKTSQQKIYDTRKQLPVNKLIYTDSEYISKYPELSYYYTLFKKSKYRPLIKDYTKISDIISYYLYLALNDKLSTEEALRQASKKIVEGQIVIR